MGALVVYAVVGALVVYGRSKGWRVDILYGDAGRYAAAVAAQLEPQRFNGDLILERTSSLRFAEGFITVYLRYTANWLGGFGNAYAFLLGPTTFLQLAGYHFLARHVLGYSALAVGYALITLKLVAIGIDGEFGACLRIRCRDRSIRRCSRSCC